MDRRGRSVDVPETDLSASRRICKALFLFYLAPSIRASADRFTMQKKSLFFSGPVVLLLPFNRTMHPGRRSFKIWKLDRIPDLPPEMGCVAWATVAALDATTKRVVRRNRRRLRRLGRLLSTQKKRRKLHYQFILHGNMRHNSFHQTARQVIYGEPLEIIISLDQQSSR